MEDNSLLEIRIWADVACPWCWIGHRRLQRALRARSDLEVRATWEPYQLQPDLPVEGISWERMLEERFDGRERARFLLDHVTELGAREGIRFDFDAMTRAPNTARAHALILAAREQGLEWELAAGLFEAHFSEGADLSDAAVLRLVAGEAGLDSRGTSRALDERELVERVEVSQREAASRGVQGVPYFLIDGRFALTGAQPAEVFTRAIELARPRGRADAADGAESEES